MKRILLTLAVAAIGGLASAQINQTVGTNIGALATFAIADPAPVVLTLNVVNNSTVLNYSTNDGAAHNITATAAAWTAPTTGVWPVLTANGVTIISSANVPPSAQIIGVAPVNTAGTLTVSLQAASAAILPSGSYTTTVLYTMN